jgi:hypothetical protein
MDVMHCEQNFNKNMLKIVTSAKDSVKWGGIYNVGLIEQFMVH